MSTNYSAKTETVNGTPYLLLSEVHENNLPKCQVNPEIYKGLPTYRQETIVPSTYMRSRGGWAMEMADRLCGLAKIDGLAFLAGTRISSVKIMPILAESESGATYISDYAYLLDEASIQKASESIYRLFEWSSANLHVLANDNLMGYFADKGQISEAIRHPIISNHLTPSSATGRTIKGCEDGDGPWYFYSWLHSVQQVLKTALIMRQHVWHTTHLFD